VQVFTKEYILKSITVALNSGR